MSLKDFQTVHEILVRSAEKWGDKTAFIFDATKESFTFSEVKEQVEKIAGVFELLGINKGDKVALMMPNIPYFPFCWLALGLNGAVMVPLNTRYQLFDASYILEHSESRMIITTDDKVQMLSQIRSENKLSFLIITVDQLNNNADGFLPEILKAVSNTFQYKNGVYAETLFNIQYTSGTTGKPKGCMLSQKYWINIGEKIANPQLMGVTEEDILLTSQPYYYMDPQWNTMASLINGATLVILDRFSPSVFWKKIQHYKVTFFYCLGNMPVLLLKMPYSEDEKNHHVRFVGCSAIPPKLHQEIEKRWNVKWFEVFGMTETGYDISMRIEEHEKYIGTNAIGRPSTDREVRIMDPSANFMGRGEVGEMVFRGKWMMDGYYKNPEATNDIFKDGWFHTGDLAYIDQDGVVFYVGRVKDMIRRSGENIAAAEVEEVIMQHKGVKMAACIPVKDEIRGEEVKAYVIPVDSLQSEKAFFDQLIHHCNERLADFKVPRYWEIKKSLPLTPSERIAKHELQKEVEEEKGKFYDKMSEEFNY